MHLGATPFSIYNTYTAEQIAYLLSDSGAAVVITEQAYADKILAARDAVDGLEHVVVVDGEPPDGSDLASTSSPRAATPTSTSRPRGRRSSPTTC